MKTIGQIAHEVRNGMDWHVRRLDYLEFAKRLIEAWQAQQPSKPVAVVQNCSIEGQRASIMSDSLSPGDYLYAAPPMPKIKQDPVAYMAPSGTCVTAEEVGYTPNWTDYYTIPLFLAPPPAIPEGYVLVPKEPSEAMLIAGRVADREWLNAPYDPNEAFEAGLAAIYKAMVEAAQGVKE